MKILARRLLLGMVFIVMLFCTSLTAFADGTGGGNTSAGGGSWSGSGGNKATLSYYGMKFTVARRADILSKGGINPNDYNVMLQAGITISASDKHKEMIATGDELFWTGSSVDFVRNANVSIQEAADVLALDATDLRNCFDTILNTSGGSSLSGARGNRAYLEYAQWSDLMNERFDENHSTMLYKSDSRSAFYDRFASCLQKHGTSVPISKEDFLKDGVIVMIPVVGAENAGYMNFQTVHRLSFLDNDTKSSISVQYLAGGNPMNSPSNHGMLFYVGSNSKNGGGSNCIYTLAYPGTYYNRFDVDNELIPDMGSDAFKAQMTDDYLRNDIASNWSSSQNWRYGFGVYGLAYGGSSKAAANLTVRATQNEDGSFNVDAVSSLISQEDGTMPVDDKLTQGTTGNTGVIGGQSDNGGNVPTQVSNVFSDWTEGYETYAYGSFLLSGGGKIDAVSNLDEMRKSMEGKVNAKESTVTSGDFNAGAKYLPDWKYRTPQDTASYFAESTYQGGRVSKRLVQNMVSNGADVNNLAYNLTAMANNNSTTSTVNLEASADRTTAGRGEVDFTGADNTMGMAVEYIVKSEPIKSFISYGKVTYDENLKGTLTIGENDKVDYTKTSEGSFVVDKKNYLITMVSNCKANDNYRLSDNNRNGQSFWNEVQKYVGEGNVIDAEGFKSLSDKYLSDTNITVSGTKKGATVSLGSDNGCGYSVFVLEIEAPEKIKTSASIDLQDYQLNFIHQDIFSTAGGILSSSGEDVVNPNAVAHANCIFGSGTHNYYNVRSNEYTLRHSDYSGKTVEADKNGNNFILYNTALGNAYTFDQTKNGVSDIPTTDAKRYTYAWDLSRGIYGDIRTISALSGNSLDANTKDTLMSKHRHEYGIEPSNEDGSPVASSIRDSQGTIYDEVGDTLTWDGSWKIGGYAPQDFVTHSHSGVISSADGLVEVTDTYHTLTESGARPLLFKGLSIYSLTLDVHEIIHKYSTDTMETGVSSKVDSNLTTGVILPESDYTENTGNGSKANNDKGIIYRNAAVSGADFALKYYPEVRMKAYLVSGDTINSKSSVTPKTVITMAELARQTKPSSMYLMKLDSSEKSGKQLTGEIYSDTMGTGTNAGNLSSGTGASRGKNNLPVIYGGSDVTLEVNPKDMNLRMYGYALDLVNYDVDKNGLKYADDASQPYTNIVNDTSSANRDPYSTWGNDGTNSTEKLKNQFNDWVVDVINSLDVDVQLKVSEADSSGNVKTTIAKEYNNFSVSMPKFKADDYKSAGTDGVFNIVVKRGDIDRTATEYKALINQIASDYGCDYATAENLFKESDMYQSIIRSIEDIKDGENKSQNVNTSEDGAHAVRDDNTNTHWYDEEVKTFVVRRYEAKPVKISDIILTDKIDYDIAPDSTAGKGDNKDNAQQKYYKQRVGQWYLSLYLKKPATEEDMNLHFSDSTNYYNPYDFMAKDWNGDKNKMLINTLYIDGADFKIASASTMDMLW